MNNSLSSSIFFLCPLLQDELGNDNQMPTLPSNSDLQGIPGVQGAPGRDGLQGAKVKYLTSEFPCMGA